MLTLAAPASLKGVLSPLDAAAALARGLASVPGVQVLELPVADGGEGTAAVLHAALGGEWRGADVSDPLGRPVTARWLRLADGTAVVEAAAAVGLPLLAADERDPMRTSSRGLGELLLAALEEQPSSLLVSVGGTATVDGGAGLREIVGERLSAVLVRVACDVRTRCSGSAARPASSARGRAPVRPRWSCSSGASRRSRSCGPTATSRAPGPAAGSAPAWRRSEPSSSREASSCST